MKRQLSAPSYIPPPSPEVLLRSTVWLEGMDGEIIDYIASLAEEKIFDSGDTIVRQGDKTDGIYLVITGLVKVFIIILIIQLGLDHSITYVLCGRHEDHFLSRVKWCSNTKKN